MLVKPWGWRSCREGEIGPARRREKELRDDAGLKLVRERCEAHSGVGRLSMLAAALGWRKRGAPPAAEE